MSSQFARTELLLGSDALNKLTKSRVAVFGLGGVGGYTVEALARAGIGSLDLIDNDTFDLSNLNRQILATHSTLNQPKVEVAAKRVLDINPHCHVSTYQIFFLPETSNQFDFSQYDYIVDAIDTVTGKIELALQAQLVHTPIISALGTGNKLDATAFEVADIYQTSICPLARIMRQELRKRNIQKLKVVYSKEKPIIRPTPPGSTSFVPSVAGLIIAGEVIKDLISA